MRSVFFRLSVVGLITSACDAVAQSTPSPPRNFLPEVAANSFPAEKPFFEALLKSGGNDELLTALGIIRSGDKGFHNTNPPASGAIDWRFVNETRKLLGWSGEFGEPNHRRRILIFNPAILSNPGNQPVTIILTDGEYKVLASREAGGQFWFFRAELSPDGANQKLSLSYLTRRIGHIGKDHFLVTEMRIDPYDDARRRAEGVDGI